MCEKNVITKTSIKGNKTQKNYKYFLKKIAKT